MCDYRIYDNELEEWYSISFCSFEGAEQHIMHELNEDFDRYTIYKQLT